MKRTVDSWGYDWHAPLENEGRLYTHETFYTVEESLDLAAKNPGLADL